MSEYVSFIQGSKENYNPSEMQGGLFLSKDTKEILLNGESYGNATPADEEDITAESGNLKLRDRAYDAANFSGKGYTILRKNIVDGKNILTQEMISEPNTVYEIRYDFDLNGAEVTVPDGCVLKFEGGNLSNGRLDLNQCQVLSRTNESPFEEISVTNSTVYPQRDYGIGVLGVPYVNGSLNRSTSSNDYVYTFTYHTVGEDSDNSSILVYASSNYYDFVKVGRLYLGNKVQMQDNRSGVGRGSDMSSVFRNGSFYIMHDYTDVTDPYYTHDGVTMGGNRIGVFITNNLLNFVHKTISVPQQYESWFRHTWAPEIFEYEGELYCITTNSTNANKVNLQNLDGSRGTLRWTKDKCLICHIDTDNWEIDRVQECNLPDNSQDYAFVSEDGNRGSNWIDGSVFSYNSFKYLLIKNEYTQTNYLYKFANFEDAMSTGGAFNLELTESSHGELHEFKFRAEAPCCLVRNNVCYFYFDVFASNQTFSGDLYGSSSTGVAIVKSDDLVTFTRPVFTSNEENSWNRHSSYYLTDEDTRSIINRACWLNGSLNHFVYNNQKSYYILKEDEEIPSLLFKANSIYSIRGTSKITIDSIDTSLSIAGESIYFVFETDSDNAYLELPFMPSNTTKFDSYKYKQRVIELVNIGQGVKVNALSDRVLKDSNGVVYYINDDGETQYFDGSKPLFTNYSKSISENDIWQFYNDNKLDSFLPGHVFRNTIQESLIYLDVSKLPRKYDGSPFYFSRRGSTSERPKLTLDTSDEKIKNTVAGVQYFDTTLGKPIYAKVVNEDNSISWVTSDGLDADSTGWATIE